MIPILFMLKMVILRCGFIQSDDTAGPANRQAGFAACFLAHRNRMIC
jgi:hypothetical protein